MSEPKVVLHEWTSGVTYILTDDGFYKRKDGKPWVSSDGEDTYEESSVVTRELARLAAERDRLRARVEELEFALTAVDCLVERRRLAAARREGAEKLQAHLKGIKAAATRWELRIPTMSPRHVAVEGLHHVKALVDIALALPLGGDG